MTIASSSGGKDWKTSVTRMRASSSQPPRYPAMAPSGTPMSAAIATTHRETTSAGRTPMITRLRTSRPSMSVPNR